MKIQYLSPSRASRWFNCPGSVRAELYAPLSEQRIWTMEGTAAHRLFELCMKRKVECEIYIDEEITLPGRKGEKTEKWVVTEDMAEHVQDCVDLVRSHVGKGQLWLENNVHLDLKAADVRLRGQLDAAWYGKYPAEVTAKRKGRTVTETKDQWQLHVLDLKYGQGALVQANDNIQLKIYGRAKARELLAQKKPIDTIHLWIYQPRVSTADGTPFRHVVYTLFDLLEFDLELEEKAKAAVKPRAKFEAGPWCLYCGAHAVCPEAEKATFRLVRSKYRADDTGRIGELMLQVKQVQAWCEAVMSLGRAMDSKGSTPVGWMRAAGKNMRVWPGKKSPEQTAKVVTVLKKTFRDLKEDQIAPRKLATVAQVERLLGKDKERKEKLKKLYTIRPSGDRLVPENDARYALTTDLFFDAEDGGVE